VENATAAKMEKTSDAPTAIQDLRIITCAANTFESCFINGVKGSAVMSLRIRSRNSRHH
jgi:hypothetical protein